MGTLSSLAYGLGETAGQDVRYDQSPRHRGNLAALTNTAGSTSARDASNILWVLEIMDDTRRNA
jgi:hypothetical protein